MNGWWRWRCWPGWCPAGGLPAGRSGRPAGRPRAGRTVDTLVLLLLAQAYDRAIYFDLALALALSFAGGLVFARFLERWI